MKPIHFISVETQIIRAVVETLLDAGFSLSVIDGEETTLNRCKKAETILDAMRTTDEDYLLVDTGGWVRFIYGNEDHEVINDYTTNLEDVLKPVFDAIDRYEKGKPAEAGTDTNPRFHMRTGEGYRET